MKNFLFTGVSGCGRIELLEDLKNEVERRGKNAEIIDMGKLIFESAREIRLYVSEKKILDIDRNLLTCLRRNAMLKAVNEIQQSKADITFLGIHATFRWRGRLIDGINFHDIQHLPVNGILNVVDDVQNIIEINKRNPKYEDVPVPDAEETNNWIIEEEFTSILLADILNLPMYVIGRSHTISNLADLFLVADKPRAYLAYPITAIKEENPQLLDTIQKEYLPRLEQRLIVFNPLVIKDLEKSGSMQELSADLLTDLGARTIVRDYHFIDQSEFVIVIYLTDKISPGVLSEINYASRHSKPVYMVYPYQPSPFLDEYTTIIFKSFEELIQYFDSQDFKRRVNQAQYDFGLFASKPS